MRARGLIAASVAAFALGAAPSARAAPGVIAVDDTADIGLSEHAELCGQGKGALERLCTLRAALELAKVFDGQPSGAERVVVSVPAGHYTLAAHRPLPVGDVLGEGCRGGGGAKVACPLALQGAGAGATVIDGEGATGLLTIEKGAGPVTIADVTLTGSLASGGAIEDDEGPAVLVRGSRLLENGGQGSAGGAAIQIHEAQMTVLESALEGNHALSDGAVGVSGGELELVRSSLTGNLASFGGAAVGAREGARVALLDTTVAQNSVASGGALAAGSGAALEARYSTIDGGGAPGIAAAGSQSIALEGSIVTGAGALSCAGPVQVETSGSNLLHGGVSACALSGSAVSDADPLLGPPRPSGALTVLPLLHGSPALNVGGASCPASAVEGSPIDERGTGRPLGAGCDLGAFESAADAAVSLAAKPVAALAGLPLAVSATVTAAGADALSGATVTIALPPLANLIAAPDGCDAAFGAAPLLTCTLGAIASGSSRTVTVQLHPLAAETLQLAASAQAREADYAPGDDSATLALPVGSPSPARPFAALVSRMLRVDRQGNARVRLRCVAAGGRTPCATSLALYALHGRIAARPAPLARRLAGSQTTFGAGRMVTVPIHLSKKVRRAIHLRRSARARLVLATGLAPVRRSVALVTLVRTR